MESWYRKDKTFKLGSTDRFMETNPEIVRFLAELELLYHVPFPYLLPDDGMLKEEQMCFFYLDQQWIQCMRQGALSIGAESDIEKSWANYAGRFFENAVKSQTFTLRRKSVQKQPEGMCEKGVRSGFLLRSEAVRCWPGMEVRCWEDENARTQDNALSILRLERIAGDVLLCIAEGDIKAVELSQPPEGIYMEANEETKVKISFRQGEDGVLDIRSMADVLAETEEASPEKFGALFLHKQKKYLFIPDRGQGENSFD